MRILGVDPGFASVGLAFIEVIGEGQYRAEHLEVIRTKRSTLKANIWDDNYVRCEHIGKQVTELIERYRPDLVAIEAESWTRTHTDSVVGLGRGVIYGITSSRGLPVSQWHPKQARDVLLNKQQASKADLEDWLSKHVLDFHEKLKPITKSQQNHAADAASVAITESYRGQNAKVFMALRSKSGER